MLENRLARIERRLLEVPEDGASWDELARLVARSGRLPAYLDLDNGADVLVRLCARAPELRELADLLLRRVGWAHVSAASRKPGRWWARSGRLARAADHWFDRVTGMPLHVRVEDDDLELVWIPAGALRVPDRGGRYGEPARALEVPRGFFMTRYPITRAQLGRRVPGRGSGGGGGLPADEVRLRDAASFLRALGRREGPTRPGWVRYDLPSEVEWEWACRGGTPATIYASPLHAVAWYSDNSRGGVRPVGRLLANPFGLHDVLGNVWEWCGNAWGAPLGASVGPEDEGERGLRGGSWASPPGLVRAGARLRGRDILAAGGVGIRCVARL